MLYVFFKQEKPEMDDFERKKKLVLNEKFKYFKKIFLKVFNGYTCKNVTKYFVYSFTSEHFFYSEKKLAPPPSADASAKNASFFKVLPYA